MRTTPWPQKKVKPTESLDELVEGLVSYLMSEWMVSADGSSLFLFLRDGMGKPWPCVYNIPALVSELATFAYKEIVVAESNPVHRLLFDLMMETVDPLDPQTLEVLNKAGDLSDLDP